MSRALLPAGSALMAMYPPFCAAEVRPVTVPGVGTASLWTAPGDLSARDLFDGPWGSRNAPDPRVRYILVERKHSGVNPGLTVRDPEGREWSVKQASPDAEAPEGPTEVVVSRLLSAAGYHQPPVYYLPSFILADDWGTHREVGGRFRLKDKRLKDRGEWSWQQNPFVGDPSHQGLLVILLIVGSTDLKNDNNTVYEYRDGDRLDRWYVVRDLGAALGETGRFAPRRTNAEAFARHRLITGVREGFVTFNYHGWHQELFRKRITPDDVAWAGDLLAGLSSRQWEDAFRAGGFTAAAARPFIDTLRVRVDEAQSIASCVPLESKGN